MQNLLLLGGVGLALLLGLILVTILADRRRARGRPEFLSATDRRPVELRESGPPPSSEPMSRDFRPRAPA